MKRYNVLVAYIQDGERHEMSYTTDCQKDASRFANYYRPKVGNGKILSVVIKNISF
jgi:hypothetical protein